MKILKPREVAVMLNITVHTLQRWDREKLLTACRFKNNRRYYTDELINNFLNSKPVIK
jgi:putative resolvase